MDHAETVANGAGVEVVARDEPGAPGRDILSDGHRSTTVPKPGNSVAEPQSSWEGLIGGVALGAAGFAQRAWSGRKVNADEQTGVRPLRRKLSWEAVVKTAEKVRGAPWDEWKEQPGIGAGTQRWMGRSGTGACG